MLSVFFAVVFGLLHISLVYILKIIYSMLREKKIGKYARNNSLSIVIDNIIG